jgi:hypothetical protein
MEEDELEAARVRTAAERRDYGRKRIDRFRNHAILIVLLSEVHDTSVGLTF